MELKVQKQLAAQICQCSPKRIIFNQEQLDEIKEGITKGDVRSLVKKGYIHVAQKKGISRLRAKNRQQQRKKGRQRGYGTRKGTRNARSSQKIQWIQRIRLQREFLKQLRDNKKITMKMYHILYMKAKGGFFRSLRHMKIYMNENRLFEGK